MKFRRPFASRAVAVVAVAIALAVPPAARAAALQLVAIGPVVLGSGGCLTADYTVDVQECDGESSQTWSLMTDGSLQNNGLCLDVANASTQAGAGVLVDACVEAIDQRWYYNSSGELESLNRNGPGCLDDAGGVGPLEITSCSPGLAEQQWSQPGSGTLPSYGLSVCESTPAYAYVQISGYNEQNKLTESWWPVNGYYQDDNGTQYVCVDTVTSQGTLKWQAQSPFVPTKIVFYDGSTNKPVGAVYPFFGTDGWFNNDDHFYTCFYDGPPQSNC